MMLLQLGGGNMRGLRKSVDYSRSSGKIVSLLYAACIACVGMQLCSATYISSHDNSHKHLPSHKTNDILQQKRYGSTFKNDWEISKYLKLFSLPMMVWRCKNAIQPFWDWKPVPVVELYCETVGTVRRVAWYHRGKKIKMGKQYHQRIMPHYNNGKFYSRWIDFRLKIYHATPRQSGIYVFRSESPSGYSEQQVIYVDISEKKKKKSSSKATDSNQVVPVSKDIEKQNLASDNALPGVKDRKLKRKLKRLRTKKRRMQKKNKKNKRAKKKKVPTATLR